MKTLKEMTMLHDAEKYAFINGPVENFTTMENLRKNNKNIGIMFDTGFYFQWLAESDNRDKAKREVQDIFVDFFMEHNKMRSQNILDFIKQALHTEMRI